MKKVLLLVSALLIVFSGVAAVSAYEGHMVDVKAHVENALIVNPIDELDFGVVFPQEKLENQVYISLSESFMAQSRYSSVEYQVYWEPKEIGDHEVCMEDPYNAGYFIPIYPYISVKIDGTTIDPAQYTDLGNGLILVGMESLDQAQDTCDTVHLILDPPIHPDYLNMLTDPRVLANDPPNEMADEYWCWELEQSECLDIDGNPLPEVLVPHADLGNNLKIQVLDIIGE